MQKILLSGIFLTVLLAFLANPAPVSIEVIDLVMIVLTLMLGVLSIASTIRYQVYSVESRLLLAVFLYFSYLVLSAFIGLLHGVPLLNMLRSLGPYISFFPLLCVGLLPPRIISVNSIGLIFIVVGIVQASYLFYLYFLHSTVMSNTAGLLRNRITLMDPRTTLPFLLAVAILPSMFLLNKNLNHKKVYYTLIAASCILLGIMASMMTLTRAIVLSIFFGWIIFVGLYIYFHSRSASFSYTVFFRKLGYLVLGILCIFMLISLIPKIHLMETGLLARFYDRSASGHVDYSDGRIYNEWIPALTTWLHAGWLSLFFGIGAGNAFTALSGEERTYIHNLCIYSLVYGGIFGLASCLWLYYVLFKTFMIRAFQFDNLTYVAFSALLASLFFYGQLFAVHKGFAFNVMLFLMIGMAMSQPSR